MDGIPALDLWDVVIEVLNSSKNNTHTHIKHAEINVGEKSGAQIPNPSLKRRGKRDVDELSNVDHVVTNASSSHSEAQLYIFEDNDPVTQMIINSRSPTMRHVSRTHKVAFDWLCARDNLDPKIKIKYVETKNQRLTCWPKIISRVMSGTNFFVCSSEFLDVFLQLFVWF